jgi:hypothetical protein
VSPVKITGQKAVVPLAMNNNFAEKVESARAVVFLLDRQGKVTGRFKKWVTGGGEPLFKAFAFDVVTERFQGCREGLLDVPLAETWLRDT